MKVNKLTPNFEVKDIRETVIFYESVLGFTLEMAVPETQDRIDKSLTPGKEYVYALMTKDTVELMFQRSDSFKQDVTMAKNLPMGASVSFYMEIEELDAFYNAIKDNVPEKTDPKIAWYGMKEFYIRDLNGYILGFAEKAK